MMTYSLAAGAVAATPIPATVATGPGRILGVLITATGAGTTLFYDNATTNSGNIVGAALGTGTNVIGSFVTLGPSPAGGSALGLPYVNGITINQAASAPGITVLFSPSCPSDGRPAT